MAKDVFARGVRLTSQLNADCFFRGIIDSPSRADSFTMIRLERRFGKAGFSTGITCDCDDEAIVSDAKLALMMTEGVALTSRNPMDDPLLSQ